MNHLLYLASLIAGIAGLLIIDHRLRLAFFLDAKRTLRALVPAIGLFIAWDLAGISLTIFSHGASRFSLPFVILPEFPLEELFFLFLLCYSALLLYLGSLRRWPRT